MTSLIVTGSVELQMDRLAEVIAQRTAVILVGMLRSAPGSDVYERGEGSPDPGAGSRRGARFGGVTDQGTEYDPGDAR
ncbi:MAG: hypothetical protein GEV12_22990 [Micromonosporaceae bacterium]|nr:hypothetical protein [Micromonosporaceae bacterium]